MKILRSIGSVVVGIIVSIVVIIAAESANSLLHPPPGEGPFMERIDKLKEDKQAMKEWIDSLPQSVMAAVLMGWQVGAFLGGAAAALLAGRARLLHAGFIGAWVLAGTIMNLLSLKREIGYTLPDWMLIIALLLPLPASLLGGKLVAIFMPSPASPLLPESKP